MTYEKPFTADSKKDNKDVRVYDMDVIVGKNLSSRTRQENALRMERQKAKQKAARMQKIKARTLEKDNVKVVAAVETPQKVRTIKAKKTVPFPTAIVLVSVICTVLFMFIMLTNAQINEFTQDISALQSELSKLQKTEAELKLDVEKKNDLRVIESVAVNDLGMVKSDDVTKKYVFIGTEDKIEVVTPETEENGLISTVMSAIGENFRNLLEYIN